MMFNLNGVSQTLNDAREALAAQLQRYADLDAALLSHGTLSIIIDGDRIGVAGDGGELVVSVEVGDGVLDALCRALEVG